MNDERTLFFERGSTWWPLLWGPGFCALGVAVELTTAGPVHWWGWTVGVLVLLAVTLVWVSFRRSTLRVLLTATELHVGKDTVEVAEIVGVQEEDAPQSARVLGDHLTVPAKRSPVPLRMADGTVVLAWARDAAALRAALRAHTDATGTDVSDTDVTD